MKKVLAMIMALAMVLSLVACGNNGDNTDTPDTPDGPTELVLWSTRTGTDAEALQKYIDQFNAGQDKWNLTMVYNGGYGDTQAKFMSTAAEERPDLVEFGNENASYFFGNPDACVPVQKFIDEDGYDASNIMAHLRNSMTDAEGNLLGVPLGNSAVGFIYNGTLLAQHGIDPNTINSLDELYETAKALKAAGVKYPVFLDNDSTSYVSMLAAQGIDFVDNDNGYGGDVTKTLLDEEPLKSATIKFFDMYRKLIDEELCPPYGMSGGDLRQMMVNGELAIMSWTITSAGIVGDLCNWELDIGWHPSMTFDKGAEVVGQGAYGCVMFIGNNGDENRARGAWEFMKVMMEDENVADFAIVSSYMPTTERGYNSDTYQTWLQERLPSYINTYEAMTKAQPKTGNPRMAMYTDVERNINDLINKMIDDPTYTGEQAAADLKTIAEDAINLYNLSKGN